MGRGLLFAIEGTDGSGKQTQSELLYERFSQEKIPTKLFSFPRYDTPTGRIVGESYLGKTEMGPSYFPGSLDDVDPMVASLYYAADRLAAKPEIEKLIQEGEHVILDRYTQSNMAHQGGKLRRRADREELYRKIHDLEYGLLELPQPDTTLFLYLPHHIASELRKDRAGTDGHESNPDHLQNAENAYLELADKYGWDKIEVAPNGKLKSREEIHKEVFNRLSAKYTLSK